MLNPELLTRRFKSVVENADTYRVTGRISKVIGLVIESDGPKAPIGQICHVIDKEENIVCKTEIVGFKDNNKILSMILGDAGEISPSMQIVATGENLKVNLSNMMLGRILDGLGQPLDGLGAILADEKRSIYANPPNPLTRARITEPLTTGVKAIDSMLSIGKGQRLGIFAGSGVGKSTLMGMIARNTSADVNVIALIGERGREVKEFIEKDLGPEGLKKTVLVVATSDTTPLVRVKSALVATTIAEYFRDKGLDVMLMMDSATRLAMAQREVGLSIGEPPTSKGYTPSVWTMFQKTMERAGTATKGTITGLYTVLVEGDDFNEPVSDNARGILDGHIMLTRKLATSGHFPAIDVLESISRVMRDVISQEHSEAAYKIQELMAIYRNAEDLINVGAYQKGSNPKIDKAIEVNDIINSFLKQKVNELSKFDDAVKMLNNIANSF